MSVASSIRVAVEAMGKDVLVVDDKSMADYAVRIAKEKGRELRQRKLETGGWELRVDRRHHRRQSDLF